MREFLLYLMTVLSSTPSSVLQLLLVCKSVPMRQPKRFFWLCLMVQIFLWTVNMYLLPQPSSVLEFVITLSILLFSMCYAPKGWRITAVVCSCVYLGTYFLSNYLLMYLVLTFSAITGINIDKVLMINTVPYAVMAVVSFCFSGCMMYLSYRILKHVSPRFRFSWEQLLFFPVPLSQAVLVNLVLRIMPYGYEQADTTLTLFLAILGCLIADLCFLWGIQRARQNSKLKEQIRMVEEQFHTQITYYRQLQDNILHVNQIRHDLTNQLQTAYTLMHQGEQALVQRQLDLLQENIRTQTGPSFCANLMVDAVLADKAAICRQKGISLDIHAQLPTEIPVEGVHLCSAFSNLLDNSIQGAMDCPGDTKKIELRAALHAGYVVIRCTNTAAPPVSSKASGDPLRLHGLGLDILRKIAREYDGSLETGYQGGLFEASLILRFGE